MKFSKQVTGNKKQGDQGTLSILFYIPDPESTYNLDLTKPKSGAVIRKNLIIYSTQYPFNY